MTTAGRRKIEAVLPATPLQEGMLVECLRSPAAGLYLNQLACRVTGPLDSEAFAEAWTRVVAARPELRTSFVWKSQERPLAPVHRSAEPAFDVVDWSGEWAGLDDDAREARLEDLLDDLLAADRRRGLDPVRPPLLRNTLVRLSPDGVPPAETEHLWLWTHHHLILDGWSMPLVLADVFAAYRALVSGGGPAGEEPRLPARRPFAGYLAWLKQRDGAAAEAFWRHHLDGFRGPLPAPADGPVPAEVGGRNRVRRRLSPTTTESLASLARSERSTLGPVLQAALAVLLGRRAGRGDVVFGLTVSGRPPEIPGVEAMLGLFINTVPVRLRLSDEATGRALLAAVGEVSSRRAGHEHVPLVEVQGWSAVPRDRTLLETLLVVENQPLERAFADGIDEGGGPLAVEPLAARGETGMPLLVVVVPGERLELAAEHDGRLSTTGAGRLLAQLETVLAALAAEPDRALESLPLLPAAERHQLLREWSPGPGLSVGEPRGELLHSLALGARSDRPALIWKDQRWSRRDLDRASGRLAAELLERGLCGGNNSPTERPVGIFLRRTPRLPVALLAVLRAGGVYVPLDPDAPAERLATVAADVAAGLGVDALPVLTEEALVGRLPDGSVRPVVMDDLGIDLADLSSNPVAETVGISLDPDRLAYVITTSGSTGRPKGVAIPHRAASAMVRWALGAFSTRELSGTLAATAVTFDLSVFELFVPLAAGGTVILADDVLALASAESLPARDEVTLVNTVPSAARELARLGAFPESVETINLAGEPVTGDLVREIHRRFPGVQRVHDLYGPSEDTTYSTWDTASADALAGREPTIGRPVAGARAVVVDAAGRPTAMGDVGELLLAGAGVARGYLGRPRETADSYRPDPFSAPWDGPGGRVYHTGDLVRHLPDGRLAFLGRRDHQVKIRGFRIELGEIQVALEAEDAVAEAVVAARSIGEGGDRRLVAWVSPSEAIPATDRDHLPATLAESLRRRLPAYMVPTAWVVLDALPRLTNGKVDRRRLASPEVPGTSGSGSTQEPPATATERFLASQWSDLLGIEPGRRDSFFALGGHSLLVTRLVARLRKATGVDLPLGRMFDAAVLADQAALLVELGAGIDGDEDGEEVGKGAESIEPADRSRPLPLTAAQERLWFLDRLEGERSSYHVPGLFELRGELRPAALAAALTGVVARHEALRTRFVAVDGQPRQEIDPPGPVPLPVVDLTALGRAERAPPRDRWTDRLASLRFDLERDRLARFAVFRTGVDEHRLVVVFHHLVSDGWSVGLFAREVATLYEAAVTGVPARLPSLSLGPADWAVHERRRLDAGCLDGEADWWREHLDGAPRTLELPTDRPRRAGRTTDGGTVPLRLAGAAEAMGRLARRLGATPFAVVLAAWGLWLGRSAGVDDLLVGTPSARRDHPQVQDLIGFFVDTLPLRLDLSGNPTFADLVERCRGTLADALAHRDLPFERIVAAVAPERDRSSHPLVQAVVAYQEAALERLKLPGLTLEAVERSGRTAKFDLTLQAAGMEAGDLACGLEYSADLFDRATVERFARRFAALLRSALEEPASQAFALPVMDDAERRQLLEETTADLRVELRDDDDLVSRFRAVAARIPDAPAVTDPDGTWTYGELARRARGIALALADRGVGPEEPVALLVERSATMVAAVLGVLEAGAAYLPLEPSHPDERLRTTVADAGATRAVVSRSLAPRLRGLDGLELLVADDVPPATEAEIALPPPAPPLAARTAYVLYTSGSTGVPKGTPVPHDRVLRLFDATRGWFRSAFSPTAVWSLFHSIAFDFSVWELWGALLHGGRVVVVPRETARAPEAFLELLERERVTVLSQTPSAFAQLVRADADSDHRELALETVVFGGEALDLGSLGPWVDARGLDRPRLVNMYGITETTVHVTYRSLEAADLERAERSPLGVAIPDLAVRVLDAHGRPVPGGVAGELCVGGASLARGYLGRPALTAERFVPDPFSTTPGARLYRSGDLARWVGSTSGETLELDYLDRIDHQVSLRGFRVELGEVEAALSARPEVAAAVAAVRAGRLVAWVVPAAGADIEIVEVEVQALRAALATRLPDYMVPAAIAAVEAFPLTANGKVDRDALPDPFGESEAVAATTGRPPAGPVEETVAAVWSEVLERPVDDAEASFFDLGGHSLLAVRAVSRLRDRLGVELSVQALFEQPTVAGLAAVLEPAASLGDRAPIPRLAHLDDAGPFPLSPSQERLWFLDCLEPGGTAYLMPMALKLSGPLDRPALAAALTGVVERHGALRTRFADGVQTVTEPGVVPLPVVDLAALPRPAAEAEARRLRRGEESKGFDLARGPLLRARLVSLGPERSLFLLTVHHIVSDGVSNAVLVRDLETLYRRRLGETTALLPELPLRYGDWAAWTAERLASGELDDSLAWWRERLADAPEQLDLPTDRPRRPTRGDTGTGLRFELSARLAELLETRARATESSRFMVFLAAFGALLGRLAGTDRLVVGTPIANRTRPELEPLVGFFVDTLALPVDLAGDPTFGELVGRVRTTVLGAFDHAELPFGRLVEELEPERSLDRTPLFQVLLAWQNVGLPRLDLPGIEATPLGTVGQTAKFDLTLGVDEPSDEGVTRLPAGLVASAALFDPTTVQRLARRLERFVLGALETPDRRLSELPLLAVAERHQILREWDGGRELPETHQGLELLHELALGSLAPDAGAPQDLALVWGTERWSRRRLARASGRLARELVERGVCGPSVERPVGVFLRRTSRLPVALLAVLRAGGAYVPLDPDAPAERLAMVASDLAAATGTERLVVLTESDLADRLPTGAVEPVVWEMLEMPDVPDVLADDDETFAIPLHPERLAYVITTSGSTGRPKGVAIPHRAAAAMVRWALGAFSREELSRTLAATAVTFDLSVFELFVPLAAGGAVILVEDALALASPETVPARDEVTLVNTVPSVARELVRLGAVPPSVVTVNLAGEPLPAELVRQIHSQAPGVRWVHDLYGPSEDTTYSTWGRASEDVAEGREPTVGRAVDGTRARVMDAQGRPVPAGVVGELWLSGIGVTRGYLGRPRETAEAYRPDPFSGGVHDVGGRVYRTGDLVRWLSDGRLDFLGRKDHQVKVRGYRIELGEIEVALGEQDGVGQAVVAAVPGTSREDRRLVAWVEVGDDGAAEPEVVAEALRAALARRLPAYMIPTALVVLDRLPRLPNGKVDRRSLPAIPEVPGTSGSGPPATATERWLAEEWRALLGKEPGRDDSFFALGGHSLLATRLVAGLRRETGIEVPLRQVFETPTLADLAVALDDLGARGAAAAGPVVELVARRPDGTPVTPPPLAPNQLRLWFLDRLEGGSAAYHLPLAVSLKGALDRPAFARALTRLVARHEALRTGFSDGDDGPVLRVEPRLAPHLPAVDLTALGTERAAEEGRRLVADLAAVPFDLSRAPLARFALLATAPDAHRFVTVQHHGITDGWSLGVLVDDLGAFYREATGGELAALQVLPVQPSDWAAHLARRLTVERVDRMVAWWRERLDDPSKTLELPADRFRRSQKARGSVDDRPARVTRALSAEVSRAVADLASGQGATLFMVLLAGLQTVLWRWTGERRPTVGTAVAGRTVQETQALAGYFVNTVVIPGDLDPEPDGETPSFTRLLARVRETTLGAFDRQELPFERLVEALEPRRDRDRTPLFSVFLNVLNYERRRLELPGLLIEELPTPEPPAKFDLTLYAGERDDGRVVLSAVYPAARFDGVRMEAFLEQMERLLTAATSAPETPVDRLPLVSPEVSGTSGLAPTPEVSGTSGKPVKSVVWRLLEQVEATPDAPAVVAEDGAVWSYRELERRSARVAFGLLRDGLRRGQTVAVVVERSPDLVAALVGVVRAGGAFAVLDPALPEPARERRLELLREDGNLGAVLTDAFGADDGGVPPNFVLDGDDAFSVTFTSGSTGTPRAILTRHAPVVEFLDWYADAVDLGPRDRVALLSGLGHDPLVRDVFAPLVTGASLAVPSAAVHGEPRRLTRWLTGSDAGRGVTVAHLTPSLGRVLALGASAAGGITHESLRRVLFGGEAVAAGDLERLRTWAPNARAAAVYGATETPQVMGWREIVRTDDPGPVGLGRGIDGVELRLIALAGLAGSANDGAALGELAEIQVATSRLACGYLGDPRATAERFCPDPFSGKTTAPGARVYRTGDLGRLEPDDTVSFAGRRDRQLLVRGHRLEPAEVEGALVEHEAVAAAVVRPADPADPSSPLAAWVVRAQGWEQSDALERDLVRHLAERLPAWMVPSVFVAIPSVPLTANGKLDLSALPTPTPVGASDEAFVAPRTDTEEALAGLFARVLELEAPVGVHDDFFRLGGHSIKATRLTAAIARELGVEVPLAALFGAPTVAALAVEVARLRNDSPGVPGTSGDASEAWPVLVPLPDERGEPFPLTDVQEAYWVGRSGAFELGSVATHSYLEIDSRSLDLDRFEHAWNRLVERHAMLRAVFSDDGTQRILPQASAGGDTTYRVALTDLTGRPPDGVRRHLAAVRDELSHQVLDVTTWPVFELRASRFEATVADPTATPGPVTRLHVSRDALLYDAWSSGLLADELLLFYVEPDATPEPLEVTFREYVLAERGLRESGRYARDLAYWRDRLATLPPGPELPLARDPESIDQPRFERRSARLEPEVWTRLRERIVEAGLTPSGALLAAYAEVLATWSKEPRFTINLTLFNRLPLHPQVDRLVGDFTSLTLLEVDDRPPEGEGADDFAHRARRLQERLWTDLDHRLVSGVTVLRELARSRRGVRMPVVFTSTLTQDQRGRSPEGEPLAGRGEGLGEVTFSITQTPQVWLDHQVGERDGALVFNWDAVEGLFPDGLLDAMFGAYVELLHRLAEEPAAWSRPARTLTPTEELDAVAGAHRPSAPVPRVTPRLLHEPFVEHALDDPTRPALVAADRQLDRGTLYRESRGLAEELRRRGVVPGELVAVAMVKGWRQVVAVLAVLQAGGAYLPVDPEQPTERIAAILRQGPVRLALVDGDRRELPGATAVELVQVEPHPASDGPLPEPLPPAQTVDDLAYVIFTSGSTGIPKGVAMEHRAVWNTLVDVERRFGLGADDRVLALSRLTFDLSVWDIFGVLAVGGALVIPEPAAARDPARWHELVTEYRVTVWNTVPALAEMWVQWALERAGDPPTSLRLALLSGDWIPLDLPERLRRLAGDELQVISLGGATEAAIWSIVHPVESVDPGWTSIPYGRPMAHQGWRVLDHRGEPRPFHVPGELYIAGDGLARGYHGAEELTAAAFVSDPRGDDGSRLYRTGDLGRWRPGAQGAEGEPPWIEFLGREDSQVKVGGYRIELGEIEAALGRLPGVRDAVAGVAGARRGATRLAAWVVPQETVPEDAREERSMELRRGLGRFLPAYMVPAAFVFVDAVPLTANGKVDRAALPRPEAGEAVRVGTVAPRTEIEARLARLWTEHLGLQGDAVGVHDDFFELGGDSVLAIRIVTRARREGLELGAADLFRNPTVAELATVVEAGTAPEAPGDEAREVSDAEAAGLSEDELDDFLASITGD